MVRSEIVVVTENVSEEAQQRMLSFLLERFPVLQGRVEFEYDQWKGLVLRSPLGVSLWTKEELSLIKCLEEHENVLGLDKVRGEGSLG